MMMMMMRDASSSSSTAPIMTAASSPVSTHIARLHWQRKINTQTVEISPSKNYHNVNVNVNQIFS